MWRALRIVVLLFVLATVAQTAWLARARTAEWKTTLRVVVYPINGDGSAVSARYVSGLTKAAFDPIEEFFAREGKKYALHLPTPIDMFIAPAVASQPPARSSASSGLSVILWSLKLRYWAWWNDTHKGPKPDVRVFVSYYDPATSPRLAHSAGLQKGLLGVVHAFARADMDGSNNVVIAHEVLHTFGATDKYDFAANQPVHPDGYAEPDRQPLHPQTRAEIMAGRIPVSETRAEMPDTMDRVVIGPKTAREIGWVR
jgi:hypothetical protein